MRILILVLMSFLMQQICFTQVDITSSNLPLIIIETNGADIVDEPKIKAGMKIIHATSGRNKITDFPNVYNGNIGIELRGSTSQGFPKKGYGLETRDATGDEVNVSLLGMPKENDWILHGPFSDKSLIRNMLCYTLARQFMEYAPRGRYCELILNGKYQGVYVLMEKIKRDKNRVDIANLKPEDISGDEVTGGYILKMDKESGSNNAGWYSPYAPRPGGWQRTYFQYDDPDAKDINAPQMAYIQQHIQKVESTIASSLFAHPEKGFRQYIDTKSLIDYILINEVSKNPDAYRLSTYFYKKKDSDGGKIFFGPVWDYNIAFGNVNYCTNGNIENLVITDFNQVCPDDFWVIHFWWTQFLKDTEFKREVRARWTALRKKELSNQRVTFVVDSLTGLLQEAQERNFKQWPVLGQWVWPNYFVGNTYQSEVNFIRNWTINRLGWLDGYFNQYPPPLNTGTEDNWVLVPNPVSDLLTISNVQGDQTEFIIYDSSGKQIIPEIVFKSNNFAEIDVSPLAAGVYWIRRKEASAYTPQKFIKIH